MNKPLVIDYYSDVLCVWAWIAQRRIDQLNKDLNNQIELRYHYVDVFGDVQTKMSTQWQAKGAYEGFAEHVMHAAEQYDDAPVHKNIWKESRPASSASSHLVLKAAELAYGADKSAELALVFRKAFFVELYDIGDVEGLYGLIEHRGLDTPPIKACMNNGSALAALMNDYQSARQLGIKGSPSYVLDGGRQILYGNVGYRVLLANVEELLKQPENEASWC
ncbi:DsbA family protein [Agaribacterium sp. ZY112]|uniref:DsbA family oxidoreductase n=1 Tax=Agaribacterium sp. ZY112 TaxID=3233574 RepID=UPI003525C28C